MSNAGTLLHCLFGSIGIAMDAAQGSTQPLSSRGLPAGYDPSAPAISSGLNRKQRRDRAFGLGSSLTRKQRKAAAAKAEAQS